MIYNRYNVDNKLIRGSKPNLLDIKRLKKEGVTQIICLNNKGYKLERLFCRLNNIDFIRYETDILEHRHLDFEDYENISDNITHNKGKTFVHCRKGLHRTSECVAAYKMLGRGKSFGVTHDEDIIQKKYFDTKYNPTNNIIHKNDSIITRITKKHNNKVYQSLLASLDNFIRIFKPTNI